jgi:transcriptional regulator
MARSADKPPNALLHGTLDALILKTLQGGPRHGYAIARFIEDTSAEAVVIEEGSLYPALYRMERRGWIEAEWGTSELGRRAKLYRLTASGRAQLAAEMATWRRFTAGVSKVFAT